MIWIRDVNSFTRPATVTASAAPSVPGYRFFMDEQIKGLVKTSASGALVWTNVTILKSAFKNGVWWRPSGPWVTCLTGPATSPGPTISKSGAAVYAIGDSAPDVGTLKFINMLSTPTSGDPPLSTFLGDFGAQISFAAGSPTATVVNGSSLYYQEYVNGSWLVGPPPAHSTNDTFDFTTSPYPYGSKASLLAIGASVAASLPPPPPSVKLPIWAIPPT